MAKKSQPPLLTSAKPPLRVCHLADIHLGYRKYHRTTSQGFNQREIDINVAFRETITRLVQIKPDVILIAGDLFHAVRPSNAILTFCFRELRRLRLAVAAPIIIVGGNHESPRRADSGSALRLLAEIDGVFVADQQYEIFRFPDLGLAVHCLPHPALEDLPSDLRADDTFPYNMLLLHAQVRERWISDFGGVNVEWESLKPHEWEYIALGHVHVRRAIGRNANYAGAIEHTGASIWAEADEPRGFLEVEFPSGERRWHNLTSPREVVSLKPIAAAGCTPDEVMEQLRERIEQVAGGIDGKIVRAEITNLPREVFRQLDHQEIRRWRGRALNLAIDAQPPKPEASVAGGGVRKTGSLREELQAFGASYQGGGLFQPAEVLAVIEQSLKQVEDETLAVGAPELPPTP